MEYGEKLRRLREEKGMTQQTLAERLFVARQTVSRWESGARYPDLLTAKRIAETLDTTVDAMLEGETTPAGDRNAALPAPAQRFAYALTMLIAALTWTARSLPNAAHAKNALTKRGLSDKISFWKHK